MAQGDWLARLSSDVRMFIRQSQTINLFNPVLSSFNRKVAAQAFTPRATKKKEILTQMKVNGRGWLITLV